MTVALITGARGFLGRHVARHLAATGMTVSGIGHGAWTPEDFREYGISSWIDSDVTLDTLAACKQPDLIVHCAGGGSVSYSLSNPFEDYGRSVSSTAAVLEYIRLHSPHTKFVYPSSAAVYGISPLPMHESSICNPISPYGIHKFIAEQLCRSYAKNFGIATIIVRFFSIYGEGLKKQLLWDACTKIKNEENIFHGTGAELRDWLHVKDAATLVQVAAKHASCICPTINGGSGSGITVFEVLKELFSAYPASGVPKFNSRSRAGDPEGYLADMKTAISWGWSPTVKWQEGVRNYIAWFKEQK